MTIKIVGSTDQKNYFNKYLNLMVFILANYLKKLHLYCDNLRLCEILSQMNMDLNFWFH